MTRLAHAREAQDRSLARWCAACVIVALATWGVLTLAKAVSAVVT